MGVGIRDAVLFLAATSVAIVMRRWLGIPPWVGFLVKRTARLVGMVSGWGAASRTRRRLSLGGNEAPLNAPSPPPGEGGISSVAPVGCPTTGGISSEPLDGVRGRRDQLRSTGRVPSRRRDQLRAAGRCPGKKDLNTPAAGLAGNEGLNTP